MKRYYFEVEAQRQLLESKLQVIRSIVTKANSDIECPLSVCVAYNEPENTAALHSQVHMLRRTWEAILSRNEQILTALEAEYGGETRARQYALTGLPAGRRDVGVECGLSEMEEEQEPCHDFEGGFWDHRDGNNLILWRGRTDEPVGCAPNAPVVII